MGGKERNKHNSKKLKTGHGTVGKAAVVGMKDRGRAQGRNTMLTAYGVRGSEAGRKVVLPTGCPGGVSSEAALPGALGL